MPSNAHGDICKRYGAGGIMLKEETQVNLELYLSKETISPENGKQQEAIKP